MTHVVTVVVKKYYTVCIPDEDCQMSEKDACDAAEEVVLVEQDNLIADDIPVSADDIADVWRDYTTQEDM